MPITAAQVKNELDELKRMLGRKPTATTSVAGITATIPIPPIAPLTVAGSATYVDGVLMKYLPPS